VIDQDRRLVAVVASPYNHLIMQWAGELQKYGIHDDTLVADSSNLGWKDKLADSLIDIRNGVCERLIVLTTHTTFSSRDFLKLIQETRVKKFLIVDEVHGVGAPKRQEGLIQSYDYRLGLSATPKRWFDFEGTDRLYDYFGGVVFEFGLKKAIEKGILSPYDYQPYFTELNEEELEEYRKVTSKIAKAYYQSKDDRKKEELFSLLCFKRQNIIKGAANKYTVLGEILDEIGDVKYCLVYCTPRQITRVLDILIERNVVQHRFTQSEGLKPERRFGGVSERQYILQKFTEGTYQALVAMRCLDEGIDIPPATTAIMLENSGNPREYIQRRGRILRNFPGKVQSTIFDIIVVPRFSSSVDLELVELEKKVVAKELKRYKEFASIADNRIECLKKIEWIENNYNIVV
jgi:superfamily II DNA or RNA helicase